MSEGFGILGRRGRGPAELAAIVDGALAADPSARTPLAALIEALERYG